MAGRLSKKLTGLTGLLTALVFIMCAARCDDDKPFASQLLTFVLPVSIEPTDSVLGVGDTLWITTETSDSLFEYHTQKKYKLSNFDFGQTSIGVHKLVDKNLNLGNQLSAASKFNTVVEIGEIEFLGETFLDFKYEYDAFTKKYLLKIGLIPKEKGVFCIALLSPDELKYEGIIDLGKHENGATIIPVYDYLFFPANNGNNNFELFKQNCLDTSEKYPENYRDYNYIRYGTFTFSVVE